MSRCALVCLLWFVLSGCGPQAQVQGQLSGAITVAGKPASGATVRFFDEANNLVGAALVGDAGEYVATDLPMKSLRVTVEPGQSSGMYSSSAPPPGVAVVQGSSAVPPASIPQKYKSVETSGLAVSVTQRQQECSFSLE